MATRATHRPVRKNILMRVLSTLLQSLHLVIGIVIGVLLFPFLTTVSNSSSAFLQDMVPEAVGIVFTVLIIDKVNQWRERNHIRQQLVRRAHSRYNHTALEALEELRVLGHLEDGTLAGISLRGANWQDANLYKTDLRGTDLTHVQLHRADLVQADLAGARVTNEQLATTDIMYGATLPDGTRYDGRYNLMGDIEYARREGVDPDSPEEMAEWYGVPLQRYLRNQQWAEDNLHRYPERSQHYDWQHESNRVFS